MSYRLYIWDLAPTPPYPAPLKHTRYRSKHRCCFVRSWVAIPCLGLLCTLGNGVDPGNAEKTVIEVHPVYIITLFINSLTIFSYSFSLILSWKIIQMPCYTFSNFFSSIFYCSFNQIFITLIVLGEGWILFTPCDAKFRKKNRTMIVHCFIKKFLCLILPDKYLKFQ